MFLVTIRWLTICWLWFRIVELDLCHTNLAAPSFLVIFECVVTEIRKFSFSPPGLRVLTIGNTFISTSFSWCHCCWQGCLTVWAHCCLLLNAVTLASYIADIFLAIVSRPFGSARITFRILLVNRFLYKLLRKLLSNKGIKIGCVVLRVRMRIVPTKCYRCLDCGYASRTCQISDKMT